MTSLSLTISNVYARNDELRAYRREVRRGRPDVILGQETQNLGGLRGYRRYAGDSRRAEGVAIYRRQKFGRVRGWWSRRLTRDVGGYSHDRHVTVLRLRRGGVSWAVINVHPNPARRGAGESQNVVLLAELEKMARRLRDEGDVVILGGDWNRRMNEPHDADHPAKLAKRLGMSIRLHGVDGLVVDGRIDDFDTKPAPGSNHELIRVVVAADRGNVR